MPRPSLTDTRNVTKSILTQNDFQLNFGVVPGSGMNQSKEVMLKCISVQIPDIEVEPLEVNLRGFKVMHKGVKKFGNNTITCEFLVSGESGLLAYNGDSFQLIYNWINLLSDTNTGSTQPGKSLFFSALTGATGGLSSNVLNQFPVIKGLNPNVINSTKAAYAMDNVILNVYNTSGELTLRFDFSGVFPTSLQGISFDNSSVEKQVLKMRATFSIDYYEIADILTTKVLEAANKGIDKLVGAYEKVTSAPIKSLISGAGKVL